MWRYAIQPELEDATIFNQKLASVTSNPETDFIIAKSHWSARRMRVINAYFTNKYFGLNVAHMKKTLTEFTGWNSGTLTQVLDKLAAVDIKPISMYFDYREECKKCMRCQNSDYMLSPWTMWVGVDQSRMPVTMGCQTNWDRSWPGLTVVNASMSRQRTLIANDVGDTPNITCSVVKKDEKLRVIFSEPIPECYMTTFTGQRTVEFDNFQSFNRFMVGIVFLTLRHGHANPGLQVGLLDQGGFAVDLFNSDKWQQTLSSFTSSIGTTIDNTLSERKTRLTELSAIKIVQDNYAALISEYASIGDFMTATFPGKTYIDVASQCFTKEIPEAEKAKEETVVTEAASATPVKKTRKKKAALTGVEEDVALEEEPVPTAIRAEVAVVTRAEVAPVTQPA